MVGGSFLTPEYARSWAEEYVKMGYDPRIIKMTDSMFELVVAESHEKYTRAARRLEQFRDTVEIDAWIYVRR